MDVRRSSIRRRWWLPLTLVAVGLALAAAKLSVRSAATGEAVIPGIAGAPVIGPAPTPSVTPGPPRVRLRVQVRDSGDEPVAQAIVEVRDRFNAVAAVQETGLTGDAILAVPASSGYVVTARKPGLAQGRVDSVTVGAAPEGWSPVVQLRLERPGPAGAPAAQRLLVGHNTPRVSLIDAASNLLLKHSEALGQGRLTLLAPLQDHRKLFASWNGSSELLLVNASDLSVEKQVRLDSGGITSLALHPLNGRLWVATFVPETPESSVLHEVDATTLAVVRRLPLGQSSSGLRFRPDGSLLYVRHRSTSSLSFVDPAAGTVMRTTRLPQWPTDLALSPDGKVLYVVNVGSERLLELDALTGEVGRAFEVGTGASSVVAHPDGRRLLVVNQMLGYVQILDLPSGQVTELVPVGRAPQGSALSADGRSLYVANAGSGTVSLVDLDSKKVQETLNTGGTPSTVLLLQAG